MRVKCTYKDCYKTFKSEDVMKIHKKKDPDHSYCERCDVDCEDDMAYLIHQIESDKHICCPMCGLEFKSSSGRDRHVEQNHPSHQGLLCAGCDQSFARASNLMSHIEGNKCPNIRKDDFERNRVEKQLQKDLIKNVWDPNGETLDWAGDFERANLEKAYYEENTVQSAADLLMHQLHISSNEKAEKWVGSANTTEALFGNRDTGSITTQHSLSCPTATPEPTERIDTARTNHQQSNQKIKFISQEKMIRLSAYQEYFNPITKSYVCPGLKCERTFDTSQGFSEHLLTGVHSIKKIRCPCCFKAFTTTSALISHCESASRKCDIRKADDFRLVIKQLTGGVISTDGYLEDGTVRYIAPKIEDW